MAGRYAAKVVGASVQVQAQAVCTSWRHYLDPRHWPIDRIEMDDWCESPQAAGLQSEIASWVSTVQPAVRALVWSEVPCQEADLMSVLSVAPRTVSTSKVLQAVEFPFSLLTSHLKLKHMCLLCTARGHTHTCCVWPCQTIHRGCTQSRD